MFAADVFVIYFRFFFSSERLFLLYSSVIFLSIVTAWLMSIPVRFFLFRFFVFLWCCVSVFYDKSGKFGVRRPEVTRGTEGGG